VTGEPTVLVEIESVESVAPGETVVSAVGADTLAGSTDGAGTGAGVPSGSTAATTLVAVGSATGIEVAAGAETVPGDTLPLLVVGPRDVTSSSLSAFNASARLDSSEDTAALKSEGWVMGLLS